MRVLVGAAQLILVYLSLALAQEQQHRTRAPGRRRPPGQRRAQNRPASIATVQPGRAPVRKRDDAVSIFIDSYKGVDELEPNYNVIPGRQGQCSYQGITMFHEAVWSPKPCVTCVCSSGTVACDETLCPSLHCLVPFTPSGQCCPQCADPVLEVPDLSGDSPVPNDPGELEPAPPGSLAEILRREEEEERQEEERMRKKDAERKRRKKQKKKEEAEKQREEERRREEEEKRNAEEERMREDNEAAAAKEKERERKEEEERQRLEEEERERLKKEERERLEKRERERLKKEERERLRALEEEEEEEEVWLRGDVFQMPPKPPTPEIRAVLPEPHEEGSRASPSLPAGCVISDVIITCENARLISIPPLNIPELKSLSLEGNAITSIPMEAFNGIPNLEWINLGKNKLISAAIHPQAFKNLKLLSRLYLDGNLLEQIPTDLPSTLQELKINENQLRGIDGNSLKNMNNLITLELEGNLLSEGNVGPLAFTSLKELSYLRLGRNHFRTIPQGLPASLQELYLENNLIEEISNNVFNHTVNLNVVVLSHNKLDESRIAPFAWIHHRNLESIDLSHNKLYLVPSFLPRSLVHLVLVGNQIERIPGYVFAHMEPGIEYLYLSYNKLDGEGVEPESFFGSYNSMTELCLDHNELITVPLGISEMTSLHFLRLNNNKIRSFSEESICDPLNDEESNLVALRLENNFIDPRKVSPTAFSCIRSSSSVVLKPQNMK